MSTQDCSLGGPWMNSLCRWVPAILVQTMPRVLHLWHMGQTLTIRLTEDLREWLQETSRRTGVAVGRIVRQQLEEARENGDRRFMRHAGKISGPTGLSSRKGFSRR